MFRVLGPKGRLIIRSITASRLAKLLPALIRRFHRIQVVPVPAPSAVTMYDSVDVGQIPPHAAAVAGYVNGRYQTWVELVKRFPKAHRVAIAVTVGSDADCLDVEQGDATPAQAPLWVKRQKARGLKRPIVYTSVSQAAAVLEELAKAGIPRSGIRLWTAHYTGKPHRCTKELCLYECGGQADATQYWDKALGRTLDASLCSPDFFD